MLSGLSINDLALAVASQETGRLVKIPGVGKKTAERLLLELKDKLDVSDSKSPRAPQQDAMSDILHALLALGYSDREAQAAAKSLPPDLGVADGIRMALKSLAKP